MKTINYNLTIIEQASVGMAARMLANFADKGVQYAGKMQASRVLLADVVRGVDHVVLTKPEGLALDWACRALQNPAIPATLADY